MLRDISAQNLANYEYELHEGGDDAEIAGSLNKAQLLRVREQVTACHMYLHILNDYHPTMNPKECAAMTARLLGSCFWPASSSKNKERLTGLSRTGINARCDVPHLQR